MLELYYSVLGIMPLSALFILFDSIVQNPYSVDTRVKLTLLDIVSGHFSQLEHVSAGSLPGNHLSEFAHIARRYIQELPAPVPAVSPTLRQTTGVTQVNVSSETNEAGDIVSIIRFFSLTWERKFSGS